MIISIALRQLKPNAEAKAVQNCSRQKAWGLHRPSSDTRRQQNMEI
jgi:hypothetical protein